MKTNTIYMETVNESSKSKRQYQLRKLKKLLSKGDVHFVYEKKDGSVRKAHGTLKRSLIPDDALPDDRTKDTPKDCFCYYDIDKEDWRTFLKNKFIKIEED